MDALAPFRIPLSALKADAASFKWEIGPEFFALFDDDHLPPNGRFDVSLEIERNGGVTVLDFEIQGKLNTVCDRCTVPIAMPIDNDYQMLVKFGNPDETTDEVIVIDQEAPELNVGKTIYDFVLISIPISQRIPDCESMENPPCDMTIIQYLEDNIIEELPPQEINPLWDELKKGLEN